MSSGTEEGCAYQVYNNPSWRMELLKPIHTKYCLCLIFSKLPNDFEEYDTSMLTFLQFALSSLDILQSLNSLSPQQKHDIIESIYELQILDTPEASGFCGTATLLFNAENKKLDSLPLNLCTSHVTMTFGALVSLLTLGDNLDRVDTYNILRSVGRLQNRNGSFRAGPSCSESDIRFVYSAVAVCYILGNFSFIDVPSLVSYIKNSLTYEGSFGSGAPGAEGHAAYTFCAVASLVLLDELESVLTLEEIERIRRWCLFRQVSGFTGRPNKDEDTCYSFWAGATLAMLGESDFSDRKANADFILHNQNPIIGGIGKQDNEHTDPLHTFMGIAGLSLTHYENLNPVHAALTISEKAFKHLKSLQQ